MKIRALMIAVALIALAAWPLSTADRVFRERDGHIWHLTIDRATGAPSLEGHSIPFDFASRFGDELIGRKWPDGYRCPCGLADDPGRIEVASSSGNERLLPKMNELARPYQRSVELQLHLNSLTMAIEHDRAVVERIDRDLAWAAWNGSWIHGSEGVRRVYRDGIAARLAEIPRTREQLARYREAALHPWDPIEPDPPR
ncbi:MAG: hypothetical protein U0800_18685 [Isosphaeraceae bacterium]